MPSKPIAAGAVGVAILLLVTGIASGALRGHSNTGTVEGTASVVARCPQGGEAISGGFDAPDFGTGAVFGGTSIRVGDNGPAWRVAGWNFDPNEPGALTTYAYCSRHKLNLGTRSELREVPPGEQRSPTATCPPGTEAISGGVLGPFSTSPSRAQPYFYTSKRVGLRGWMGAAFNEGGDQGAMHTYAYCDKRPLGLEKRSRSTTVEGSMGTGSVTAKCPKGQEAYSGGFASPNFGNDPGDSRMVPYESRRIGRRTWRVAAENFGDQGTLTAFAYCKA